MEKTAQEAYIDGFIDKCAEYGVDPEELIKQAQWWKSLMSGAGKMLAPVGSKAMGVANKLMGTGLAKNIGNRVGIWANKLRAAVPAGAAGGWKGNVVDKLTGLGRRVGETSQKLLGKAGIDPIKANRMFGATAGGKLGNPDLARGLMTAGLGTAGATALTVPAIASMAGGSDEGMAGPQYSPTADFESNFGKMTSDELNYAWNKSAELRDKMFSDMLEKEAQRGKYLISTLQKIKDLGGGSKQLNALDTVDQSLKGLKHMLSTATPENLTLGARALTTAGKKSTEASKVLSGALARDASQARKMLKGVLSQNKIDMAQQANELANLIS